MDEDREDHLPREERLHGRIVPDDGRDCEMQRSNVRPQEKPVLFNGIFSTRLGEGGSLIDSKRFHEIPTKFHQN